MRLVVGVVGGGEEGVEEGVGVGGAVDGKEGGGGEEMKSEQPEWVNEEGGLG